MTHALMKISLQNVVPFFSKKETWDKPKKHALQQPSPSIGKLGTAW
jgi:hypothetical protein